MTSLIKDDEIFRAIATLKIRQSVGVDGITDGAIKPNQKWLIQIFEVIPNNCKRRYTTPTKWLKGVISFPPKRKDMGNSPITDI